MWSVMRVNTPGGCSCRNPHIFSDSASRNPTRVSVKIWGSRSFCSSGRGSGRGVFVKCTQSVPHHKSLLCREKPLLELHPHLWEGFSPTRSLCSLLSVSPKWEKPWFITVRASRKEVGNTAVREGRRGCKEKGYMVIGTPAEERIGQKYLK